MGRKLREACLAIQLNRKWSKQRILRSWLNTVYFGNRSYGIEAASQTYFSKRARELNLREAALLAGLPQAPSAYDPFVVPDVALARRNTVLRAMLDNGDITPKQFRWAVASSDLRLRPGELYSTIREPYFFGYVQRRADRPLRREHRALGRAQGLRPSTRASSAPRRSRSARHSNQPGDPASASSRSTPRTAPSAR